MDFNNNQPIYLQIVDFICEKILLSVWKQEEKIPSVRELAVQLSVNPNTVARSYDFLRSQEIITDKRGIGYFISSNSMQQAKQYRKNLFIEQELPLLFRTLNMLDITPDELDKLLIKYKRKLQHEK
ncbi:GntR family transcriptional regulator [Niabella aurantiaca]|uniref:GntR family transcriptional regulator n=1 Tax=Niabella aurantiaca TaxID=379900 RepID=UPI00037D5C29|nr:GntR family transcriptional regulator [Niabella aurantiaca]